MSEKTLYQQIIDDFMDSIERNDAMTPAILKGLEERLAEDKKLMDKNELISLLKPGDEV